MDIYNGKLSLVDSTHVSLFFGQITINSTLQLVDTTHIAPMIGYVLDDSTYLPNDNTYMQGSELGTTDMTLTLRDWTYAHGVPNIDGTLVDGTLGFLWYDPAWIHYSIYYQNYDTSVFNLVGYRYRDPVRHNVGQYSANMIVGQSGHYENRWVYQRETLGYAKEKRQKFTSMSAGLDAMRDYPTDSTS
jgi:hypothetical protein